MPYRIRLFREDDADALAALAVRSIEQIGPRAYLPAQVAAWAGRHGDAARFVERARAGHIILLAVDENDAACAYALLESTAEAGGHLDHLYCDPAHTRRGLAERLLTEAETQARAMGARRLYSEASELARPALERASYLVTHRRDFEVDGVPIHNFAMEKSLA
ncbi:GNAT family N-acetyltransferase [Alteriqipengyuania sp. 357]